MDPKDKVALITGGARIGAEVAGALARRGVKVAVGYRRSKDSAERTVGAIESRGGEAIAVQGDLARPDDARTVVERAAGRFGRLDILVNMASLYRKVRFEELDAASWDESIEAEARSAYLTALAAAPFMKKQGAGRIINFSDWLCASGRPRYLSYIPYYTAKTAILGLTQALALELAPEILVNAIAPGPILAPPDLTGEENEKVKRETPLGRWGGAEEIAKAVLFLVETDFVTGECVRVDGGRHLK